jgi:heme exporter protein A
MESKADSIRRKAASRGAASRDRPKATTAKKTRKAAVAKPAKAVGRKAATKTAKKAAKAQPTDTGQTKRPIEMGPALRLVNVAIMRGERLIQQTINHEMRPGQMTLLTGPNGSGKSSLLRAISGRLSTVRGSISCTVPLLYVGHQDGVSGVLSGRQNLASWAGMNGVADAASRIENAIGQLNAAPFANLPTRVLSRGQRRRFALARLLLGPPGALWLLDEPSVGLDIDTMQVLDSMISSHLGSGGLVLAATHLPLAPYARPEVLALSDTAEEGMDVMLASQAADKATKSAASAKDETAVR